MKDKIIEILKKSQDQDLLTLAKQLQEQKETISPYMEVKLYYLFLKNIDDESQAKLLEIDEELKRISTILLVSGGWYINNEEAYKEEYLNQEIVELEDNDLYHLYRDQDGYHTRDNVPETDYQLTVRQIEEDFLNEQSEKLKRAHELLMERDNILFNRSFVVKPGSEELVDAILKLLKLDYSIKTPILPKGDPLVI